MTHDEAIEKAKREAAQSQTLRFITRYGATDEYNVREKAVEVDASDIKERECTVQVAHPTGVLFAFMQREVK
jgi:hypothetical protein